MTRTPLEPENQMNMPAMNIEAARGERPEDTAAQLVSQYARVADRLPGGAIDSVRQMREDAIAAFAEKGLPHRRVEEWKYTDLRRMMSEAYAPAETQADVSPAELDEALGELAGIEAMKLVFVNGHFSEKLSAMNGLPPGVELMSLAKALYAPADWLLASLGKVNAQDSETVTLLNTAFMTDGFVLRLAEDVALDRPLHVVHVSAGDDAVASSLRNVIVAENGAEATLIESFVSLDGATAQTNTVTEVKAGNGSKLRLYKLSAENADTQHLSSTLVDLGEKADYRAVNFADGNALARHQTFLRFSGDNARGHYYAAQLLRDRQHCDMTLLVDHDSVGCESRETVKAVLADKAHGVFQAKVWVRPDAQQTDGRQMAQSMMLSDEAEFYAKPELEIYADDVKCNHGATSGALDEDLLFYMRARGIPEAQARSLLIQAFVGEVIDMVEHETLREVLSARVANWLA
jgi:Fe-S cluster assembly protein SufD